MMTELEIFTAAVSSDAYVYLSLVATLGYRPVTLVHRAI
jgi:hypothetical protein